MLSMDVDTVAVKRDKVFIKLPKTGLGNMLIVWARGYVFAYENNFELFVSRWWGIRLGTWLRNESRKRLYWGYFKEDNYAKRLRLFLLKPFLTSVTEPNGILNNSGSKHLYVFDSFGDYFHSLKPYRTEVKNALLGLLQPALRREYNSLSSPVIGIHIRRGDFKRGSDLTPNEYFINSIRVLRELSGKELPVTIFSDAAPDELSDICALPSVEMSKPKKDILDILHLSKSKICMLSIGSTFSFWSGFLNDGIVLRHPNERAPLLRPQEINTQWFEGAFDPDNVDETLKKQLQKL
jgi:hypothetical protein